LAEGGIHVPVLPGPVLSGLAVRPGGIYLDATVGLGGHADEILRQSAPNGLLFGLDRDPEALARASERLKVFGGRVRLAKGEFSRFREAFPEIGAESLDGVLADLGVSSLQLDEPRRGFSFQSEGPLDMRMDPSQRETAQDYLRRVTPDELEERLRLAGEERTAKRIVRLLLADPDRWTDTRKLAEALEKILPRHGGIHPATRVFMALRMAVNRELENLSGFLKSVPWALKRGGRLAIISFHSTEDRIVKRFASDLETTVEMKAVTKSPVTADPDETGRNPRSRSAKLRIFEKK
jgi:16S rRNA (cytosine1402-N4)-methyltransferase